MKLVAEKIFNACFLTPYSHLIASNLIFLLSLHRTLQTMRIMTVKGAMPTIPEEDNDKPRKPRKKRKPPVMLKHQTEDFDQDPAALVRYLKELAAVDLRDEWEREGDDEDNDDSTSESPAAGSSSKVKEPEDNDASTSESPAAGSSSSKGKPKKRRTNKHKTHVGNRPPFIKNRPPKPGEVGYETFVPEYFTMGELEDGFCTQWEYVFHHRMT